MTPQEARELIESARKTMYLPKSKEYISDFGYALEMAIKALEQINCLTGRPCEVCEFHSDNGCRRWKCVFEEGTK